MLLIPVRIAASAIHGLGVFATEPIPKGTEVWKFTPGFDQEFDPSVLEDMPHHARERMLHFGYIDSQVNRLVICCDDARLINHSDTPNLHTDYDRDKFGANVAIRDIQPGEELTVDYRSFEGDYFNIPELAANGETVVPASMKKTYRKGGVGAMMDEYERAAGELKRVLETTSQGDFNRIVDTETKDDDCRSIQTIMTHVVRAGYGYANYIRKAWNIPLSSPESVPVQHSEAASKIDAFLAYTAQTLEGKWEMTDEQIQATVMRVRWGVTYDLEQLMEHAIVHILRHRRQVERFLGRMGH